MNDENFTALRLTFALTGSDVQLRDAKGLAMRVAPTDALTGYEAEAGLWFEVRDASERVLFRRVLQDPRRPVEGFSPGPERTVFRATEPAGEGRCVVVVPWDARATVGVMCEGAQGLRATMREIARFDLAAVR